MHEEGVGTPRVLDQRVIDNAVKQRPKRLRASVAANNELIMTVIYTILVCRKVVTSQYKTLSFRPANWCFITMREPPSVYRRLVIGATNANSPKLPPKIFSQTA